MKKITVDNIVYQLDTGKKTAVVIGYNDKPVEVIIPEFIEYENKKYKVTSIGYYAFDSCYSLQSINIPDSVTSIERGAFYLCNSLTSITIPDSVTYIESGVFYLCNSLTSITIPNSVTKIGEDAFRYCQNLESITIPDSVTKIGDCAFCDCCSLKSVTIGNNITSIGEDAFRYCKNLESINIPDSVTYIGYSAFYQCSRLTSIDIPNSVTSIGIFAFDYIGLTLLKRYTEDGKLIAYKAFSNNMTCKKFQYEEGKSYEMEGKIKLCKCGFHACTNPLDIFNYYNGEIGKDIYIHEVYLSGDIDDDNNGDSKVCASKIEIGRRLNMKDINDIINNK